MDIEDLRYFVTGAECGSISAAAEMLYTSQPHVSQVIKRLEKELGAELFVRRNNRIHLTDAGQRFYEEVSASLQQLDNAVERLQQPKSMESAHLHLLVTALRVRTAEMLSQFRRSHPNVTFTVWSTAESAEGSKPYDLCISDKAPGPEYDSSIPLVERQVDLYAAMSPNHPLAHRQLIALEELKDEPTVSNSTSPLQKPVGDLCMEHGFTPNVVVACDDLQCLQRYIRSGTGIAITAPYSWPDMGDPHIRFVKIDAQLSQQISIYWDSRKPREPVWFQLTEQLQSYFNPTASFWKEGKL